MGQHENSVMYAVEQVCALYGVQLTREQSRQFNVQGAAGRWRPMFFGIWVDDHGNKHYGGKADFLARPRIQIDGITPVRRSVPLWIECKSLDGKTNRKTKFDQAAFEQWVTKNGDFYMRVREDVRPLIAWFDEHGVEKNCEDIALANVVNPIDATEMYRLPCKWCGLSRDEHIGVALGCPLHLKSCDTRFIGKVWSPDLRKKALDKPQTISDTPDVVPAKQKRSRKTQGMV